MSRHFDVSNRWGGRFSFLMFSSVPVTIAWVECGTSFGTLLHEKLEKRPLSWHDFLSPFNNCLKYFSNTCVSLGQSIAIVLSCKVRSLQIILGALQNSAYLQVLPAVKSMNPLKAKAVSYGRNRVLFCVLSTRAWLVKKCYGNQTFWKLAGWWGVFAIWLKSKWIVHA